MKPQIRSIPTMNLSNPAQNAPDANPNPIASPLPARCRLVLPHFQSLPTLKTYLPDLLRSLEHHAVPVEVKVVDDGSSRLMQKWILSWTKRLSQTHPELLDTQLLEQNHGKGYAIRQGWSGASDSIELLAFVDADGSIPADAVSTQLLAALQEPNQLRCGIRPAPSRATRSLKRRFMAACFATYARHMLGIEVKDPQCGFKMLPRSLYQQLHRRLKVNRFAFDCELLAHAALLNTPIQEVELPWLESPTSTVRSIRDGWRMVLDLRNIRRSLQLRKRLRRPADTH